MRPAAFWPERGILKGVADEGGWWPELDVERGGAGRCSQRAIERAGFRAGDEVAIALDVAASQLGRDGRYRLAREGRELDTGGMIELLLGWLGALSDRLDRGPAGRGRSAGLRRLHPPGARALPRRRRRLPGLRRGPRCAPPRTTPPARRCCSKPNQRGTLTETRAAWDAARHFGMAGIVSARSGESEDVTIVHLAVGWGADQLKVGSFSRSERMAKWNEGLRIEEALGGRARFRGRAAPAQGEAA